MKVATPPEAAAEAPEAMVPGPQATVRLMVSALPVFDPVSTLPNVSSTDDGEAQGHAGGAGGRRQRR